jgi:hypothetical protein
MREIEKALWLYYDDHEQLLHPWFNGFLQFLTFP